MGLTLSEVLARQSKSSNRQIVQEHLDEILAHQQDYSLPQIYEAMKEITELSCSLGTFKNYVYQLKSTSPSSPSPVAAVSSSPSSQEPEELAEEPEEPTPELQPESPSEKTYRPETLKEMRIRLEDQGAKAFDKQAWIYRHPYSDEDEYPGYPWEEKIKEQASEGSN